MLILVFEVVSPSNTCRDSILARALLLGCCSWSVNCAPSETNVASAPVATPVEPADEEPCGLYLDRTDRLPENVESMTREQLWDWGVDHARWPERRADRLAGVSREELIEWLRKDLSLHDCFDYDY